MMLYKLAFQNFRKNLKDYFIYFLTLTFGVCLFYIFNSMEKQQAMAKITRVQSEMIDMMMNVINVTSVFVAIVLGFLVIYANRFLIRRRKKELGLYLLMGMERGSVSLLLILETIFIGIFSLAVGLLLGVFASQGLAVITASMFEIKLDEFTFFFSFAAAVKSVLYFGLMFLIVIIFNVISVSKFQLIDLIYAGRKNEKLKMKNIWTSVLWFLVSLGFIGTAYYLYYTEKMSSYSTFFVYCALGAIGTFLFFFSLSGFMLKVVQSRKSLYYRGLNMFVMRQIHSKITTAFVSMSFVCLMLLLGVGGLATGITYAGLNNDDLEQKYPVDLILLPMFDAGSSVEYKELADSFDVEQALKDNGVPADEFVKSVHNVDYYRSGVIFSDLFSYDELKAAYDDGLEISTWNMYKDMDILMIPLSVYNEEMKLREQDGLELKEGQIAIATIIEELYPFYEKEIEQKKGQEIGGTNLSYYPEIIKKAVVRTAGFDMAVFIVPDQVVSENDLVTTQMNIQYKGDDEAAEELVQNNLEKIGGAFSVFREEDDGEAAYYPMTRRGIIIQNAGAKITVTYLAVYIGAVFLIACAAVLALQQLSESSDNATRYELLRKIGTEEKEINKSLFLQILIYFLTPVSLGIVHIYVGMDVVNRFIMMNGKADMLSSMSICAAVVVFIYGSYMAATYIGSKIMIRERIS